MEKLLKRASSNPFQPNPAPPILTQPNPARLNPDQPNTAQRSLSLYRPNTAPHSPLLYLITDRLAFLRSPEITHADAAPLQLAAIGNAAHSGCQLIPIRVKDMSPTDIDAF